MITRKYEHGGKVWDGKPDKWIDFSANINPMGCPQEMCDEILKAARYTAYYPDVSMKSARHNIASYLGVDYRYIVPTNGGISALDHIVRTIKPQRVIIIAPSFVEYRHIGEVNGAEIVELPLLKDRRHISLPIDDIRRIAQKGDMLILCNPVNPIGHTYNMDELCCCMDIMNDCGGYLVIDEAFIDYYPQGTMMKLVSRNERLIIAGSLTKMFAIPGVRLGYICANEKMIDQMQIMQMPWVLSCFASSATNGLKYVAEFVEKSIDNNNSNREALKRGLEEMDIYVFSSRANFLLVDLKNIDITANELASKLREHNILIRDCSNYDTLDEYYARFAVKSIEDNNILLDAIKGVIDDKG